METTTHQATCHITYDATGLVCPMPILKAKKQLKMLESGELLGIWTDDLIAPTDLQEFCKQTGHQLVSQTAEANGSVYTIIQKK